MQFAFTVQKSDNINLIRACSAEQITVHDQVITKSVVLSGDRMIQDWPPTSLATLQPEHLDAALQLDPEVILLGTGARQQFPDARVQAYALGKGVGFEVMDTAAACRTYNILLQDGRRVVAALIIAEPPAGQ